MAQSDDPPKYEKDVSEVANELADLKKKVHGYLTEISDSFGNIVTGIEGVKSNETYFHIGKDSVQPLIELKAATCEIFNNVRNNNPAVFEQEFDTQPFEERIAEMKKQNMQTRQLISYLNSTMDGITKLMEHKKRQNAIGDEALKPGEKHKTSGSNSDPGSSVLMASSESLGSDFSFFVNRDNNVITSSPIGERKEQDKD